MNPTAQQPAAHESPVEFDVAVVGGGPGGSTVASLLARRGHRVVLIEKARHPRFHIGESLLPKNLPLLDELGVADEIAAIGMYKPMVEFHDPGREAAQPFFFADAIAPCPDHAYQVRRSEFDEILLRNSARHGVTVHQGVRATDARIESRSVELDVRDEGGSNWTIRAAHLVDASGRDTFMASRLGGKARHPRHASAAIYGHFHDAQRLAGDAQGAISIFWFEHGWFWFIPLRDGITSVGAVCWPYYLKTRRVDVSRFLLETIATVPALAQRLRGATLSAPATATGNYSYVATRMCAERVTLVGDAFAFVDPVFSSGVYLAMKSGFLAADLVDGSLRAPATQARLRARYERAVRRGLRGFGWLIVRMSHPVMRALIMAPRNELRLRDAVVSLLAGDVYGNPAVDWRLALFRLVYYLNLVASPRLSLQAWRRRQIQIAPAVIRATDGSG